MFNQKPKRVVTTRITDRATGKTTSERRVGGKVTHRNGVPIKQISDKAIFTAFAAVGIFIAGAVADHYLTPERVVVIPCPSQNQITP